MLVQMVLVEMGVVTCSECGDMHVCSVDRLVVATSFAVSGGKGEIFQQP